MDSALFLLSLQGQLVFPPGGNRHAGREGRPEGIHRPLEKDAPIGRRQEDHAHKNPGSPLRHDEPPHGLPPQLSVSVY